MLLSLAFVLKIIRARDKARLDLSIAPVLLCVSSGITRKREGLIILVHRHARRLRDVIRNGITGVLVGNQGLVSTIGLGSTPCVERRRDVLNGGAVDLYPGVVARHLGYYIRIVTREREGER